MIIRIGEGKIFLKKCPTIRHNMREYKILESFETKAAAYRRFNKLKRFAWYKDIIRVEHLYYGYGIYMLKEAKTLQMKIKVERDR